jgi:hypothetical protein
MGTQRSRTSNSAVYCYSQLFRGPRISTNQAAGKTQTMSTMLPVLLKQRLTRMIVLPQNSCFDRMKQTDSTLAELLQDILNSKNVRTLLARSTRPISSRTAITALASHHNFQASQQRQVNKAGPLILDIYRRPPSSVTVGSAFSQGRGS